MNIANRMRDKFYLAISGIFVSHINHGHVKSQENKLNVHDRMISTKNKYVHKNKAELVRTLK